MGRGLTAAALRELAAVLVHLNATSCPAVEACTVRAGVHLVDVEYDDDAGEYVLCVVDG